MPSRINTYGQKVVPGWGQVAYEQQGFLLDLGIDQGGLGRYGHFRNLCNILFPKIVWDDWLELKMRSLCDRYGFPGDRQWVTWAGCASSGKTFGSALYASVWWLAAPECSSVILTTTTGKALRRRVWPEIQNAFMAVRFGNFVDSRTTWQFQKGDDKQAIFGIAVEDGAVNKAVDNIKGIHTRRQLVVLDEAQGMSEAVSEAAVNLIGYPQEFQCLTIGNPWSRFDQLGKAMEPLGGWSTVHPGIYEWEGTKRINGKTGRVIRFDAEQSPNVLAGKIVAKHLIDRTKLNAARDGLGEDKPRYWAEFRGYPPPDGLVKTVLTESEIVRMNAMGTFIFTGASWWRVAGHDPSFGGGDRPILWFARVGEIEGGGLGMLLEKCVVLKIDQTSTVPINFQLAHHCIRECDAMKVGPSALAVDSTGAGRPYCDILEREWQGARGRLIRVGFGDRPSEMPVSKEDQRLGTETYFNKAAELAFGLRELVMSGQLRGLDVETSKQVTARKYDDEQRLIKLEKKVEFKLRFGRSPDEMDGVTLCVEAARRNGLSVARVGASVKMSETWEATVKAANAVYEHANYEREEVEA